ncbi:molybdenum cofactor guanylyltransferase [Leifsonia xyli]|uniref:molybdenum cofactor guanylyltransferase n=1 Tax=Leifsonia xyli TaxID=1575 RepID=UPI003D66C7A7
MTVAAIILAGGRGRRMGTPKHAVSLSGQTLLDRALDAVAPLPTIVVGPPSLAPAVSLRPFASLTRERPAFAGPAAAIAAALADVDRRSVDADAALILSCDLAFPAEAVALLLDAAGGRADGWVLQDAGHRMQWLCGLYRLDSIRRAVAGLPTNASLESAPVAGLFAGLTLTPVPDPDGASFDIDTPADLVAAEALTDRAVAPPHAV